MSYRDAQWLLSNITKVINFYHPLCIDEENGGYINQFMDDGTIFDYETKHLVGTCRFIFNYSIAAEVLQKNQLLEAALHGIRFLEAIHRQPSDGYSWVIGRQGSRDDTRHCYGHAFVLLAVSTAARIGIDMARPLIDSAYNLLEKYFWEPEASLYVDQISGENWNDVMPYRGQNANMHMCEALIAAFETTKNEIFLDRANTLAYRICNDLIVKPENWIWEHYDKRWRHDWNHNSHDPKNLFQPYGFLPGHFAEWAKLLLILDRLKPSPWYLPTAKRLFTAMLMKGWDDEYEGINYTFGPDGRVIDYDRYYWVVAECIAAAALLGIRTNNDEYWQWYNRFWNYADNYFIDHVYGGWYRVLDRNNNRYDNKKSIASKTDYHPVSACYEILRSLNGNSRIQYTL